MKQAIFFLFVLWGLGGCSIVAPPPEVHFYVLAAPPEQAGGQVLERIPGPRVGVMPVALPAYLQRPQMVLREDNSVDVSIADFHRWGEDLDLGVARVLSVSLSNGLRPLGGVAAPLRTGIASDLRVQVELRGFEGRPDGRVRLEAAWSIQRDGRTVAEGLFRRQAPAGGSFVSLVQTQSRLLDQLGSELAAAISGIWT